MRSAPAGRSPAPRRADAAGGTMHRPRALVVLDVLPCSPRPLLLCQRRPGHVSGQFRPRVTCSLYARLLDRARRHGASVPRLVRIRLGHSPDPDDAFMFWALTTDLVDTRGLEFEQVLGDIQTLNQWARAGRLEVTAISLAAYPFIQEDYALLPQGASIGSGYGPIVVARETLSLAELSELEIVVPGTMTTSFLTLGFVLGSFRHRELPFD